MSRRVVAIGGGHGLARALEALRLLALSPTAVVTAADDGGSSGRLRRDLDIIAPGDLRRALLALATDPEVAGLMAHRFGRGELAGHALGNLALVALAEQHDGDFQAALDALGELLGCAGRVVAATHERVRLKASASGRVLDGQVSVATSDARIERVWLEPSDPAATPAATEAIDAADTVVLGPGSLFTSIVAALLVPGIGRAVVGARRVVLIANVATQPGETNGLDLAAHVAVLADHVPDLRIDTVVVHDGPQPEGPGLPLGIDVSDRWDAEVVTADLCARDGHGRVLAAHDATRLAPALARALGRVRRPPG